MNKLVEQTLAISTLINLPDSIRILSEEMELIREELATLKQSKNEGWMPIAQASQSLCKSVSAVRQRLKHPEKPMPQGKVWKQESKGCGISVHLGNYRIFM